MSVKNKSIKQDDVFLLNVVETFASNRKLFSKIDACYKEKKFEAYQAASTSPLYSHRYFQTRSIEFEVYCKRILGLLLLDEDYYFDLCVKTGWPRLYPYLEKEAAYEMKQIQKISGFFQMSVDEAYGLSILIYSYMRKHKRSIDIESFVQTIENTNVLRRPDDRDEMSIRKKYLNTNKQRIDHVWKKFCRITGVDEKIKTVDQYFEPFFRKDRKDIDRATSIDAFPKIAHFLGMDVSFLGEYKISDDELTLVLQCYLETLPKNRMPDYDHMVDIIAFSLYGLALVSEYKKIKEYFFKSNQETIFNELKIYEDKNHELTHENEEIRDEVRRLRLENQRLQDQNSQIGQLKDRTLKSELAKERKNHKKECAELAKEVKGLQVALKQSNTELERLEKTIFDQPVNLEDIDLDEAIAWLNQCQGLYYMSSPDFGLPKVKAIKEQVPGLNLFDGIMPDKAKVVFIDWQLISHKDYNEVMSWIKKKDLPYYFIQSSGVNETMKEMARIVNEK